MKGPLKKGVTFGQRYVDEAVMTMPRKELLSPLARSVASMVGNGVTDPIQTGWNRVRLRWMKPGLDGRLVSIEKD